MNGASDLVERLEAARERAPPQFSDFLAEAINHIEELRAIVRHVEAEYPMTRRLSFAGAMHHINTVGKR